MYRNQKDRFQVFTKVDFEEKKIEENRSLKMALWKPEMV